MIPERTQEDIVAQCEARLRALEREAEWRKAEDAKPKCRTCGWCTKPGRSFNIFAQCREPLVKGFGDPPYAYDTCGMGRRASSLCGPEKALWKPIELGGAFRYFFRALFGL